MRTLLTALLLSLSLLLFAPRWGLAQEASDATDASGSYHASDVSLGYRGLSSSGYEGRVGQYDSLNSSPVGSFDVTDFSHARGTAWKARGEYNGSDDYWLRSVLDKGDLFTLSLNARSFVHHPDKLLFGPNADAPADGGDLFVNDLAPDTTLFTVKRTIDDVRLDYKVPRSPVTLFVHADEQTRKGDEQTRFFDMGGTANCDECHLTSRSSAVDYKIDRTGIGSTFQWRRTSLTYEHEIQNSRNELPQPVDSFGATLSSPDDELPAGVSDTLPGDYVHDVTPGHHNHSDTLTLHSTLFSGLSVNSNLSFGRTTDTFTNYGMKYLNAFLNLRWNLGPRWRGAVDLRQNSTVNEFIPAAYPLFPNTSIRRLSGTFRATRNFGPHRELEVYYKRVHTGRTNANLFPQFYSPDNLDLLHVVPETVGNTIGTSITRTGERRQSRYGYELTSVRAPGYLTDPGQEQRLFYDLTLTPKPTAWVMNDLSLILQRQFPMIARRDTLFTETLSASLTPRPNWSLQAGYAYGLDALRTDLTYGTDPPYGDNLVPYKGVFQSLTVSSKYDFRRGLSWTVGGGYTPARSEFTPHPAPDNPAYADVLAASQFADVDSPQTYFATGVTYQLSPHSEAGLELRYAKYADDVHPEFSGKLTSLIASVSRQW